MSRMKVMIAAVVFLAATCIKFTLPAAADALRTELRAVMAPDTDLRAAMTTLGTKLAGEEGLIAALKLRRTQETLSTPSPSPATETDDWEEMPTPIIPLAALSPPPGRERPRSLAQLRADFAAGLVRVPGAVSEPPEELLVTEMSTSVPETPPPEEIPVRTEPVVESFLSAQSVYADYAVPANVSYAMPTLGISYVSPLSGTTSSGFGYRIHPLSGEIRFHYGTDFSAWSGTEICCFADGTVSIAGEDAGFGNYLIVEHAGGCRSLYAHCSELLVSAGETVRAGQVIARVGETGQVTGPHLHFELQQNDLYLNPEYYVNQMG